VCGAVAALAVRNDFRIGAQTQRLELGAQLLGGFQKSFCRIRRRPIPMDRSRNRAAALGAHALAEIFLVAAHIEDLNIGTSEPLDQKIRRCGDVITRLAAKLRGLDGWGRVGEFFCG